VPDIDPTPWPAVFGNDHPVEIEIGPGRGDVLLAAAAAAPGTNFFAVERATVAAHALAAEARRRALDNVRVVAADARCVVARLVPAVSVSAYHIYFPDPWPKRRHRRRRLTEDGFPRAIERTLVPGGAVHLATDLGPLLEEFAAHFLRAGLALVPGATLPVGRPLSVYERRYARTGTHYLRFVRTR
jgi:tRNA (guanine-N7-)-methyltransferase